MLGFSGTLPATRLAVPHLGVVQVGLGRALVAALCAAVVLIGVRAALPSLQQCRRLLLVSLGVVATPTPVDRNPNLVQMALAMPPTPPRADLLVIIEHKGRGTPPVAAPSVPTAAAPIAERAAQVQGRSYRGRY